MAGSLGDIHPVAIARKWLLSRERVTDLLLGGGGIGTRNEPPYPCVILTDPPGYDRKGQYLIAPLLQVEVMGDLDGTPSRNALRRLMYVIEEELVLLPLAPILDPTAPVVTSVDPGGGGYVPLPTGQPRYIVTLTMSIHPGRA